MDTEEGKTSVSSNSRFAVRIGTNTMPPPAPNNPFTAPANVPAKDIFQFTFKTTPPAVIFSTEGVVYAKKITGSKTGPGRIFINRQ